MKKTYIKPQVTIIDGYQEEIMDSNLQTVSATSLTSVTFNSNTSSVETDIGTDNTGSTDGVSYSRGNSNIWDDWDE